MQRGPTPEPVGGDEARSAADLAAEVADLRRRLAFYDGFDDLIQQNISRSGDLLRRASEQQARAERELAATRADLARTAAAQRDALSTLAEELGRMRGGLDALAARVEAARADLDGLAPGVAPVGPLSGGPPIQLPNEALGDRFAPRPGLPGGNSGADLLTPRGIAGTAGAASGNGPDGSPEFGYAVVVHGVASVDEARAFQTWIAGRPGVRSATPREFAGGLLRLDILGAAVAPEETARWPGAPLEVVETGPGAIVLRRRGPGS